MFLANVVFVLHLLLIIFMITVPFVEVPWSINLLHFTVVGSIIIHWLANDDSCFLTLLESKLRGIPTTSSFMYSLVSPVYQVKDETLSQIGKIALPVLGGVSLYKLLQKDMRVEVERMFNQLKLKE